MRLIIIITVPKDGSLFSPLIATVVFLSVSTHCTEIYASLSILITVDTTVSLQFQLRSLMTTRYLNSSTWGKSSSPLQSGHSTFFWLRDLERLILIPITSYSTGNHRSDKGKSPSGKAKKQR